MNDYHPTVWRTCRVLANTHRLAGLKAVLHHPGECVGEIATRIGAEMIQTSMGLRMLQARGLLSAQRDSRWVRYYPDPDPLVPDAAPILRGFRRAFLHDRLSSKQLVHGLTAFTHPRRLLVLRYLQKQHAVMFEVLAVKCKISPPALYRHMKKLHARGLVTMREGRWMLCRTQKPLIKIFLTLIAHGPEA